MKKLFVLVLLVVAFGCNSSNDDETIAPESIRQQLLINTWDYDIVVNPSNFDLSSIIYEDNRIENPDYQSKQLVFEEPNVYKILDNGSVSEIGTWELINQDMQLIMKTENKESICKIGELTAMTFVYVIDDGNMTRPFHIWMKATTLE